MLKIDNLRVIGFKSFHDRTALHFDGGITAVVGPNGCGKSNIGDAIHWVLGEQSARTLRGLKMEDVIFAGSVRRKPLGMAEVTLRLTGAAGILPEGREAVEISRRLFRSGESGYLIDGKRARLKDIQELLNQAHVGARTYAVIEQGKIDALLTARPKERRLLIEEAAGIIGFKQKKRLAELKLEATEANLFRVNDIVTEVERQIRSLKRQAARARRYKRMHDEMRELQRKLFVHEAKRIDGLLVDVRSRISVAADHEAQASAEAARLDSEVEKRRSRLETLETETGALRDRLHEADLAIDRETNRRESSLQKITDLEAEASRLQEEVALLGERDGGLSEEIARVRSRLAEVERSLEEASGRRKALEDEHADRTSRTSQLRALIESSRHDAMLAREPLIEARNEIRRLGEELERAASRDSRLEADLEGERRNLADRESALEKSRGEREAAEAELTGFVERLSSSELRRDSADEAAHVAESAGEQARGSKAAAAERFRTLSDAAARFAGTNEGVGFVLTRAGEHGIRARGVVADYVRAGMESERAAEGYLSNLLPAVLVEENEDVVRAIETLRREGGGRCCFLAERNGHRENGNRPRAIPEDLGNEPGVLGALSEKIRALAPFNGLITDRFDDAVIVDNLPRALDLHGRFPDVNFVTSEGEVVYSNGLVAGGRSTSSGEGLLAQSRAIEEAQAGLVEVERLVEQTGRSTAEARALLERAREEFDRLTGLRTESEKKALALKLGEGSLSEEVERCRRGVSLLESERNVVASDTGEMSGRQEGLGRLIATLETDLTTSESRLTEAESEERQIGEHLLRSGEELAAVRSEEATLSERREGLAREMSRLEETAEENSKRSAALRTARIEAIGKATNLREEAEEAVTRMADLHERRTADEAALRTAEEESGRLREENSNDESKARAAREALDAARTERMESEVESARLTSDREHVAQRCLDELGRPLESAAGDSGETKDGEAGAVPAQAAVEESGEEPFDAEACEQEITTIREKLEGVGPVNLMALEEFSELEERYRFLNTQRQDLVSSIESLRESIRKINRSTRERFMLAYEQVRRNFNEIFQVLFGGGRADIRLEEDCDPLDAGLEISAQPPGKRLQGISLLSGGEKAMSAIALLFAIFRHQPSPFCILDEVDAPLDEINVGRFTRMLQEYAQDTQFIVITHNRRSMESADLLYGVTMPEPGVSRIVSMRLPEAVAATNH